MTIVRPNKTPRSVPYIRSLLRQPDDQFVIVDIGARGGIDPLWSPLKEGARIIGFDPDEAECNRLNAAHKPMQFYPVALHNRRGEDRFFLTNSDQCGGYFGAIESFFGRFPNYPNNKVVKEVTIDYDTFDNFADAHPLPHVDFIKIDTEGSELLVLEGAAKSLDGRQVLGVLSECWWDGRIKGQPSFAELDIFLREKGYFLFDLSTHRYPRSALPVGRVASIKDGNGVRVAPSPLYTSHGQILTGDALYFRDPVYDLSQDTPGPFRWDDRSILRLIGLLDIFDYQDFAIEIADFYRPRFLLPVDVDALIDLLVPDLNGMHMPFDSYHDLSRKMFLQLAAPPSRRDQFNFRSPDYTPLKNRAVKRS